MLDKSLGTPASPEVHAQLSAVLARMGYFGTDTGRAQQAYFQAKDGWKIFWTTGRIIGGPHDGKFLCQAFKPVGKGARTGKAEEFHEAYRREFATRKAAKARALAIYHQHSPKKEARDG